MPESIFTDKFLMDSSPKEIYNTVQKESYSLEQFYETLVAFLKKGHHLKAENIAQLFLAQSNIFTDQDYDFEIAMSAIIAYSKMIQKKHQESINVCLPFINSKIICYRKKTMAYIVAAGYKHQNQYDKAFEYNHKVIEWLPKKDLNEKEKHYLVTALFNIGSIFSQLDDINKAEKYYDRAYQVAVNSDDYPLKTLFISNYAIQKYMNNKMPLQDVLEKLEAHINYCEFSGDVYKYALAQKTKIDLLIEGKRYKEATHLLEKDTKLDFNLDIPYAVSRITLYFHTKRYDRFVKLLEEKIGIILNNQPNHIIRDILTIAVDYYTENKDAEKYYYYSQLLIQHLNKMYDEVLLKKIIQIETKVKLDLKEHELNWLRELNETKQKHNQELAKKNKELQDFASITAHDLKSPLRTIIGFVDVLNKRLDLNKEDKDLFEFIRNAGKTASSLIDDLLSFARSGTYSKAPMVVDLSEIVQAVKMNLAKLIEANRAGIIIEGELPKIMGHQTAFLQLFQNIIQNSIKYSKEDEAAKIIISCLENTDNEIVLSILDNGRGMSEDVAAKIFNPLFTYHKSASDEGHGLGLATCTKIVEFYKGKIVVESQVNIGSRF